MRKALAITTLLLIVVNSGWAQEIDSSVLQAEAAAHKTQEDATAKSQQAAPTQTSGEQASPAQTPPAPTSSPQNNQQAQASNSAYMLPPGTKLPLGLLRPLRVKAGQDVYLQITFPVTVGSQMLIPPGAYVQGIVQQIVKKDRRSLQFAISSANLIFSNGYTVPIPGTVTVGTTNAALAPQPGSAGGQSVPAMNAVGSVTPPPLPPLPPLPSFNTMRNVMIGVGVATAVGTVVLIALAHNRDPEIEVGTPLEMILPAPLYLDATRVAAAIQQYDQQTSNAPVPIVQPPVKPKMCYDSGSPGTPDTIIPGSPGTPDTVIPGVNGSPDIVIPGTPRTPDTVIPGTPGTPSSAYPCPK
ncbi:MAG TPA: hypothetical protein VKV30_00180 [Candidatus Angelobacter sp.]|nr:hypothetical protein [Candidatus Angelobacter sp.]